MIRNKNTGTLQGTLHCRIKIVYVLIKKSWCH